MATKSKKKKKSKSTGRQVRKIILVLFEMICLVLLCGCIYGISFIKDRVNEIEFDTEFDTEQAGINEDIKEETVEQMKGYTNIAIFGLDTRGASSYKDGNSDTIIIASINNDTNEVRLISVYRDTYLSLGNGVYDKANSAYNRGGASAAVQMLNANLDLNITEYICVNWSALIEAIDALGGVDIEVNKQEIDYINGYLNEIDQVLNIHTPRITSGPGKLRLTGAQATAYCRIRYTAGSDFLRTSRQRVVLQAMLDKVKTSDLTALTNIATAVFDDIHTSLSMTEILGLGRNVANYNIAETSGFPIALTTAHPQGSPDSVVAVDLATNVKKLHNVLFGNADYEPSATVQAISDSIVERTGVDINSPVIDTSKYNDTTNWEGTDDKDKQ